MDILNNIQDKYCPMCDAGSAGKEIGYLSPGSCIDYSYDELDVNFFFGFFNFYFYINIFFKD